MEKRPFGGVKNQRDLFRKRVQTQAHKSYQGRGTPLSGISRGKQTQRKDEDFSGLTGKETHWGPRGDRAKRYADNARLPSRGGARTSMIGNVQIRALTKRGRTSIKKIIKTEGE